MTTEHKGMEVFILLDRTGSMSRLWEEAVTSVNAYVRELKMDGADDRITLAVFDAYDTGMQFDVLRHAVPIKDWKDFDVNEVWPRGSTPLLDALMRLITRAEEVGSEKTAIVVMTDGEENASTEARLEDVRAALERARKRNWQVNFLGADFNGFAQTRSLGVDDGVSLNFMAGHGGKAMLSTARLHQKYRTSKSQVEYTDQDRNDAGEDQVK